MTFSEGILLPAIALVFAAIAGFADAQPASPDAGAAITRADTTSIQRAIDDAIARKLPRLVIPPGVYEVTGEGLFHLRVRNAHDLEIVADGVTLVFPGRSQHSMLFRDCDNVTFRGATLRRKTSPISQGVIEAIRDDGRSIDVRIDKGYPTDIDDRKVFSTFWASVFTMDRSRWLAHYRAATPPVMERLESDLFRVAMVYSTADLRMPLQVGQPLAWRGEVFDDLSIQNCRDMKFIDVTVEGGSGMCFHEMGGDGGNLYRNCKVTYAPPPPGATERPMWASSADAFHSADARRGPTIENCLFEGMDDDGIAIHGFYACVVEGSGDRVVVWRVRNSVNKLYGRPGDRLRFYDTAGAHQADRRIVATRELKDFQPDAAYTPHPLYRLFSDVASAEFVELTLDEDLAPGANWLVSNADEAGAGYVIRDTVIRDGGQRGIIVKADDGLIEGNTIERVARAAIEFMPEHVIWPESDYSRNVIVRNNVIRDVAANRQEGFLRHAGALTIYGYRAEGGYIAGGGHRNILIEGNTFEDNRGPNLLIASASGITVRNNRFVRPMATPSPLGPEKGVDPEALVFLTQCEGVAFEGNAIVEPGPALKRVVAHTPTAEASGSESGFVVESAAAAKALR